MKTLIPIQHGTAKGYHAELRRGLGTCSRCRAAIQDYNATRPRKRSASPILRRLVEIAETERGRWTLVRECPSKARARNLVSQLRRGTWPAYQPMPSGQWEFEWRDKAEVWAIVDRPEGVCPPLIHKTRPKR